MDISRVEDEIASTAAIYPSFERDKAKAWQSANTLPAFTITIAPDDPELEPHVSVKLHVKYCNTYPKAPATFTVQQPRGISVTQVQTLTRLLREESLRLIGQEMVFEVAMFCSSWITSNNTLPKKNGRASTKSVSLATEMTQRAKQAEEAQRMQAEQEDTRLRQQEAEQASLLVQRIAHDVQQKREVLIRQESEQKKLRAEAMAVIDEEMSTSHVMIERFDPPAEDDNGISFDTVALSAGRRDGLVMIYPATPVSDSPLCHPFLDVHRVDFDGEHYRSNQGKKKLREMQEELRHLITLRHANLLRVFAVKMTLKLGLGSPPALCILMERNPALSLAELLENCDILPTAKALAYMSQGLMAVGKLHEHDIVHRAITPSSIWLTKPQTKDSISVARLGRTCYHARLLDLYKSNRFGPYKPFEDIRLPESWLPLEVTESPYQYSSRRDIWYLGVVFLQMIRGVDIVTLEPRGPLFTASNSDLPAPLRRFIISMFEQSKKRSPSCVALIEKFATLSLDMTLKTPAINIQNARNRSLPESPETVPLRFGVSPETSFFGGPPPTASVERSSRYREDWEELEFLGKGGFGSVVKARNKLDGRIYAVKKVKLRRENDGKIFREVNTLSRLSHSSIVRYYTTWLEKASAIDDETESSTETESSDVTSRGVDNHDDASNSSDGPGYLDINDASLFGPSFSRSASSFPSIHFGSNSKEDEDSPDSNSASGSSSGTHLGVSSNPSRGVGRGTTTPVAPHILYIQMEFVERQTLKETIEEGLSEERGWVLFRQILEALVHISSLGILHRDIKLTNIFIDGNGDVKVGDFGLATSSLVNVDPSDRGTPDVVPDMTSGVGTGLYIAPEIISRKTTHDHSKADMYSLGIVFFEMNMPPFSTDTERYHVITNMRLLQITWPPSWPDRPRQKEIIQSLLQHNPDDRPSASKLVQSKLLPEQMEEDNMKEALRLMVDPLSPRYEALLRTLFDQTVDPAKGFSYDATAPSREYATLNPIVRDQLINIFRLHGAIEAEPPLLMPFTGTASQEKQPPPVFLDRQGELVCLPKSVILPFARSAALAGFERIKRYFIGHAFEPAAGQPRAWSQAAFDTISPDTESYASEAEMLFLVDEILEAFPGVGSQPYEIYISHTGLVENIIERIPPERRMDVNVVLDQVKSSFPQKRALLIKQGLSRALIDEIEALSESTDIDVLTNRLKQRTNVPMSNCLEGIRQTIKHAKLMGVKRRIFVRPFLMRAQSHFGFGIVFEFRGAKRTDVVARGGRYDHLIDHFTSPSTQKRLPIKAVAVQIALERISQLLATHQGLTIDGLIKEKHSFGRWSARRCDVYVVSFLPGFLEQRLELASMLWQNGISADVMYESGVARTAEGHLTSCLREGIMFIVWARPKSARHEHAVYKVKSILKGTEHEVRPQDLIAFLSREISDQKKADQMLSSTGAPLPSAIPSALNPDSAIAGSSQTLASKDLTSAPVSSIHVIFPGDRDAQRKKHKAKITHTEKAFAIESELRREITAGLPVISIDVPSATLAALAVATSQSGWLTSDELWRSFVSEHNIQSIATPLREALLKKKTEQVKFVLLLTVRDDKPFILRLS